MTAVGILHPGAMGAAVGALIDDGWWAPEGRSAETAERARDAGLREASLPELLERCAVVLSICPPHAALDVAHVHLALLGSGVAVVLHVGAMVAVMGLLAVLVYDRWGLSVLRKGWVNLDAVWAGAFVLAGVITFFT